MAILAVPFLDWCGDWRSTPAEALQFSAKRDANYHRTRHITRDRGALAHDDRLDAVAGAVAHFQRAMMMKVDQAAKGHEGCGDRGRDRGLPRRLQSAHLPRHTGQWGPGACLVEPAR